MHTYICLSSRRFLNGGFYPEIFCLEGFVRGGFCPSLFYQNTFQLNITFNFRFHMYEIFLQVWRHMLLDSPPPCHKLSHLLEPPPLPAWRTLWTAPMHRPIAYFPYFRIINKFPSLFLQNWLIHLFRSSNFFLNLGFLLPPILTMMPIFKHHALHVLDTFD